MLSRVRCILPTLTVALGMTILFWWPLYGGAGFIGGDLYPYFFPQKAFYADCLKAGAFPLWNDLTGFGYPVLGESQTGAAYPFHMLCYRCFDLNTAYNIEHLLHYVICFLGTWLFARRIGLSDSGAYLAATVFTYGWFPPRACLEWAILTGAWMPVALWCVESFLQTRLWRYAIGLSATIGVQLLAGHFHLAFITQLLVATYAGWRLWGDRIRSSREPAVHSHQAGTGRIGVAFGLSVAAGVGLAAVQLLPTWELKQRSSREIENRDYDPAYGHLPPVYASQMAMPWNWYSPRENEEDNLVRDVAEFAAPWHWFGPQLDSVNLNQPYQLDLALQRSRFGALKAGTNKVEAHLYCGLVPLWFAVAGSVAWMRRRRERSSGGSMNSVMDRTTGYWLIAGFIALVYATGILLPIGRHVPGFSFFRGSGRYGIVTTLSIALSAGQFLTRLMCQFSQRTIQFGFLAVVFASTCGDLWLVSRMVKYTFMVSPPRIAFREQSEVRQLLMSELRPPRLLAPGPNVGNLLGVSCVPWYLGIAPVEYVDPQFALPELPKPSGNHEPLVASPELIDWLSRSGVTHVLNFDPLDESSWHAKLVWKGVDPLLNRVWGRLEPIYLYRFQAAQTGSDAPAFPGRVYITDEHGQIGHVMPMNWRKLPADSRRYSIGPRQELGTSLILTELAYPGWVAQQGDKVLDWKPAGMFRSVQLSGERSDLVWVYRPRSVYLGAIISLVTFVSLATIAHFRFWHPQLVDRVLRKVLPSAVDQ